jgi:hypothetical protein
MDNNSRSRLLQPLLKGDEEQLHFGTKPDPMEGKPKY